MLTGCTFRRIPSRVPLSTLTPTQYPFEREKVRLRGVQLRQQPRAILLDEALEQVGRQVTRVLRQQRPLHPLDYRLARRQDMRIDHEAHVRIGEPAAIQQPCILLRRLHGVDTPPPAE